MRKKFNHAYLAAIEDLLRHCILQTGAHVFDDPQRGIWVLELNSAFEAKEGKFVHDLSFDI